MRSRIQSQRRGVTLLFVVSMIVLFLLMGTTFVVVSNDFFRDARKRSTAELYTIDRTAFLERTLYNLLRGPELTNVNSPFRGHDLLSDQYGYGLRGSVASATAADLSDVFPRIGGGGPSGSSGDQFIVITLTDNAAIRLETPNEMPSTLSIEDNQNGVTTEIPVPNLFNGQVISFVDGPSEAFSTRIFLHTFENGNHQFVIPNVPIPLNQLVNFDVVINGLDFSGTGAGGFTSADFDSNTLGTEALMPNRVEDSLVDFREDYLGDQASRSVNESYDAADFQNMFLSGRNSMGVVIPSFDREVLRTFHANDSTFDQVNDSMQVTFRPIKQANSQFPFGITEGDLGGGDVCEVDTDLDGELDSVFIDPGYGVMTDENGRNFKPLVAVRIVDLDGRLNLNAHGNLTQVDPDNFIATRNIAFGNSPSLAFPRGQGYGPPEISLQRVLASDLDPSNPITAVDRNNYSNVLAGRHGFDGIPGDGQDRTVATSSISRLLNKQIGYPVGQVTNEIFGTVNSFVGPNPQDVIPSSFSTAMDIHGRFALFTPATEPNFADPNIPDFPNVLPVIDMETSSKPGFAEITNNAYEMAFDQRPFGESTDTPYTLVELERILRQFDIDSQVLPNRLWNALGDGFRDDTSSSRGDLVTTSSFEVPVTRTQLKTLITNRLSTVVIGADAIQNRSARAEEMMLPRSQGGQGMFAPELLFGLKMDVNRAIGNGFDDNGNGVVDDPLESDTFAAVDLDGDGNPDENEDLRTRYAKQLYMLTLLLAGEVEDQDLDGNGLIDSSEANSFQRAVAQWAINVVDFRDPDSIMTRFAFDVNPWDGTWDVDNAPRADADNVVWGLERPELMITETLGVHQRRTEDLTTDPNGENVEDDGEDNFDQRLRPEPFAFIELYNPWTQSRLNQHFDASLYGTNGNNFGVALDRRSDGNGSSPVWRMVIQRPARGADDPEDLRFVYFVDPMSSVDHQNSANVEIFFPSMNFQSLLRPGAHAVVGNLGFEDPNNNGQFRSFMGRRTMVDETMDLMLNTTRHIRIAPQDQNNDGLGTIAHIGSSDPTPRNALVIPIDQARTGDNNSQASARPFSVSDRFGGYPMIDANPVMPMPAEPVSDTNGDGDGFVYLTPYDQPFDRPGATDTNRDAIDLTAILADNGTTSSFRIVQLQRLANPLLPWNADSNPYLSIDSLEMDLIAFNGVPSTTTTDDDPGLGAVVAPSQDAVSLERGEAETAMGAQERRQLWSARRDAINVNATPVNDHEFEFELRETLGRTNDAYIGDASIQNVAFPWLTWNNRPYTSHLELTNVPFLSSQQLTQQFSIDDGAIDDPFSVEVNAPLTGRFRHLVNFFASDGPDGDFADLYQLMDYLEVPSRFLGTERPLNPSVFGNTSIASLSRYRVPGRVNINTIYSDRGVADRSTIWNAVQREYAQLEGVSWSDLQDSRSGSGTSLPTDFANPFRAAGTGNNVPISSLVSQGPNCTLFRSADPTADPQQPLFDFDPGTQNAAINSDRSAYFRNAQRQRLGNLVTTRSSVFAIWITVAYFEVDDDGNLGAEIGSETGEAIRNRGFYIFDRSIPVAFEPGRNHNIEQAILVRNVIE